MSKLKAVKTKQIDVIFKFSFTLQAGYHVSCPSHGQSSQAALLVLPGRQPVQAGPVRSVRSVG